MKNLFYKLKKNRDGMTLVELLVAFTLLVLIVFVFSPMLLYSFGNLQLAGEKYVDTYNSKSVLEKRLSIREKDNYYGEGLVLSFKNLGNNIVVHAKQVASDVAGLETLYAPIQREVKIAGGSNELSDNTSTFSVFFDFANISTTNIAAGTTHKENTIVVDVTSLVQKENKIEYTVRAASGDKNRALVEIKNCDITYSPLRMDIYYYNDNGLKREATKYIYISPADMMFVGDATTSNQYITSAGVGEDGKLLLSARTFVDRTLGTGGAATDRSNQELNVKNTSGTFNSVKWVPNANGTGDGGYVMVGANGLVRRLWHLTDNSKDAQNLIFDKVRQDKIGDTTYWKYTWGSDYINADVVVENQGKEDKLLESAVNNVAHYGTTASAVYFSSNYDKASGDVHFMRPISKVVTVVDPGIVNGSQAPATIGFGNQGLGVNFQVLDSKSGSDWSSDRNNRQGWCNFIGNWPSDYGSNLANNTEGYVEKNKADLEEKTGKTINTKDYAPLVFFSADGTIGRIDRAYVPKNNYWGSFVVEVEWNKNKQYGFPAKTTSGKSSNEYWLGDDWDEYDIKLWIGYLDGSGTSAAFKELCGCPPYEAKSVPRYYINNYHSVHSSTLYRYTDRFISDYHAAWTNWGSYGGSHTGCKYCDVTAEFSKAAYTYNKTTGTYKYYQYDASKSWEQNQQTVAEFLLDSMTIDKTKEETMPATATIYPVTANTALTKSSNTYDAGYMRLVAYTNDGMQFSTYDSEIVNTCLNKTTSALETKSDVEYLMGNACADIELTDFFCDSNGNITYVGISPVAATVMGPEIAQTSSHEDIRTNNCRMFVVTSNGKNGYTIKQYNGCTDANYASINTSSEASATGSGSASFTMGYSSNYASVFGNLDRYNNAGLLYDKDRTKPQNVTSSTASVDADYPDRFMSFLSYTTSGDYTFGAGYRVSGTVGINGVKFANCAASSHGGLTINDMFSSRYFKKISYSGMDTVYCTTYPEGSTTIANEKNCNSRITNPSLIGYYLDVQALNDDSADNKIKITYKECTCTASFTSFADLSRAVTNKGVIEYKKNDSSNFSLLQYSIEGGAKENFKFTSISAIKQGDSYLIIVGAEYTDNTGTHAALYKGTSAEASGVLGPVTLTPVADVEKVFNSIKAVYSIAKENAYAIIASGEAVSGAKMLVSQDSGASWATAMVTGASHTYCINDIASNGDDYIYAVGSSSGNGGIVCYAALSSLDTWTGVTTCYDSIKCNDDGTYSGESSSTLPNLYSVSSKNA